MIYSVCEVNLGHNKLVHLAKFPNNKRMIAKVGRSDYQYFPDFYYQPIALDFIHMTCTFDKPSTK